MLEDVVPTDEMTMWGTKENARVAMTRLSLGPALWCMLQMSVE